VRKKRGKENPSKLSRGRTSREGQCLPSKKNQNGPQVQSRGGEGGKKKKRDLNWEGNRRSSAVRRRAGLEDRRVGYVRWVGTEKIQAGVGKTRYSTMDLTEDQGKSLEKEKRRTLQRGRRRDTREGPKKNWPFKKTKKRGKERNTGHGGEVNLKSHESKNTRGYGGGREVENPSAF